MASDVHIMLLSSGRDGGHGAAEASPGWLVAVWRAEGGEALQDERVSPRLEGGAGEEVPKRVQPQRPQGGTQSVLGAPQPVAAVPEEDMPRD